MSGVLHDDVQCNTFAFMLEKHSLKKFSNPGPPRREIYHFLYWMKFILTQRLIFPLYTQKKFDFVKYYSFTIRAVQKQYTISFIFFLYSQSTPLKFLTSFEIYSAYNSFFFTITRHFKSLNNLISNKISFIKHIEQYNEFVIKHDAQFCKQKNGLRLKMNFIHCIRFILMQRHDFEHIPLTQRAVVRSRA